MQSNHALGKMDIYLGSRQKSRSQSSPGIVWQLYNPDYFLPSFPVTFILIVQYGS